jgi:hypothetical protein
VHGRRLCYAHGRGRTERGPRRVRAAWCRGRGRTLTVLPPAGFESGEGSPREVGGVRVKLRGAPARPRKGARGHAWLPVSLPPRGDRAAVHGSLAGRSGASIEVNPDSAWLVNLDDRSGRSWQWPPSGLLLAVRSQRDLGVRRGRSHPFDVVHGHPLLARGVSAGSIGRAATPLGVLGMVQETLAVPPMSAGLVAVSRAMRLHGPYWPGRDRSADPLLITHELDWSGQAYGSATLLSRCMRSRVSQPRASIPSMALSTSSSWIWRTGPVLCLKLRGEGHEQLWS